MRTSYCFELLRYITLAYSTIELFVTSFWSGNNESIGPSRRYFLSSDYVYSPPFRNIPIPEDTVYVEEWVKDGIKKFRVLYEGEEITDYEGDAFAPVQTPWIWVGNKETEHDLTRVFDKFLVPGNVIRKILVDKLVDNEKLMYIESKSFNELDFPGDGLVIQ
jgi:hypothetical protein